MCLAQGPQRSDADEARTRGPSVSSQALSTEPLRSPVYNLMHSTAYRGNSFGYTTNRHEITVW